MCCLQRGRPDEQAVAGCGKPPTAREHREADGRNEVLRGRPPPPRAGAGALRGSRGPPRRGSEAGGRERKAKNKGGPESQKQIKQVVATAKVASWRNEKGKTK